jgi:hypothetical protein
MAAIPPAGKGALLFSRSGPANAGPLTFPERFSLACSAAMLAMSPIICFPGAPFFALPGEEAILDIRVAATAFFAAARNCSLSYE